MLSSFIKRSPEEETEQGMSHAISGFFQHAWAHLSGVSSLFSVELKEYAARAQKRYLLLALAGLCAFLSYLALWALLLFCLCDAMAWTTRAGVLSLSLFILFHGLIAVVLAWLGFKTKLGSLAPMTQQELQSDLTCINLSINKSSKP